MAKGQMRKTKETRKPKKEKPKSIAANPQRKPGEDGMYRTYVARPVGNAKFKP